jgi:hypothetical protein
MMVSLSYDFSTFVLMKNSCATIFGRSSMFNSVLGPYVFIIVFLSYPMYSHDFSCFSRGITFHGRSPIGSFSEELKSEEHFSEDAVW